MISATFIFVPGEFDARFHQLDSDIASYARQTEGYIGEDSKTGRVANVYYWRDETGLRQLMQHPSHLLAKQDQQTWLEGYQVIISQVLHSYGNQQLSAAAIGAAQNI